MAGGTTVNRSQMATAAVHVQDAVDKIRHEQSQLAGYHAQLQGSWVGDASNAFTSAYERFNADFTKVINALEVMHDKLVGTRAHYESTEEANVASANKVAGILNH
jgi:WXG100 family type VII secretion target